MVTWALSYTATFEVSKVRRSLTTLRCLLSTVILLYMILLYCYIAIFFFVLFFLSHCYRVSQRYMQIETILFHFFITSILKSLVILAI